jgi:hypothetical protein
LDTDPISLFNANASAEMVGLFFRVDSSASAAGKVALIKTADYSSDFSFMLRTQSTAMQEVFRISKDKKVKVSYDASNYFELEATSGGMLKIATSGGGYGIDVAPTAVQTGYTTPTNLTTDRTFDADSTTVAELADVLGTLIEDLKAKGIISA